MSQSFSTRESNRHKRQISVGDSPTKPFQNEILTLTHYQLESLNKDAFITNTPYVNSVRDKLLTERRPKPRNLNIKLNAISQALPAINQPSLSISKTVSLNTKDAMDYVIPDSLEAKTTSNSSSQRIALSDYDTSRNLLSNHSNISRFQMCSPTGQEENLDLSYIRQKEIIESNPHFSKYNKSINMLDKLDASRMILPTRDIFYYPEQKRSQHSLIKKLLHERKDELLLPVMKIVKESSPESIELTKDKSYQFKIDVATKVFPMHVDIKTISGSFEVFVSKSNSMPGPKECDYHWKEERFTADYNATENIKYLYFRICALENLHVVININFSGAKRQSNRSISVLNLKTTSTERKLSETRRKPVYEYFHPNMSKLEVQELKEIARQIKKEKKAKSLSLAGNQNLVEKNIQVAHEYKENKQSKLFQMVQKQAVLAFNSKVKKEILETERTGHKLYISVRHELKRLEEGWKSSEAKLKQERIFSQQNWRKMLALVTIVDCLAKTRSEIKTVRIRTETQETSARRIQKGIHSFLQRSGIRKPEDGDQSEERQLGIDLETRILAGLYLAMNTAALLVSKRKKMKAIKMIGRMFRDMHEPDPIREALDIYVGKVIRIQNQWRSNRLILNAQIELWTLYWQRYCRVLIREEQKKRKKDNTEAIGKMTPEMIQKHARAFVLERRKVYLEALKLYYQTTANQNQPAKSVFITTEVFENSEPAYRESNVTSIRPSLTKLIKVSEILPKRKYTDNTPSKRLTSQNESKVLSELDTLLQSIPIKPKLRIQPSRQELRLIFTKIVKEIKLLGL